MTKLIFSLFLFLCLFTRAWADNDEIPSFNLMIHAGAEVPTGFIPGNQPAPELGAWMGVGISDRWDGYFGLDYYTMPNLPITINGPATVILPSSSNATTVLQPTDDVSLSVDTRWYPFNNKWDYARGRYNTSFYFLGGLCMDLVVDGPPPSSSGTPSQGIPLVTNNYDILFGLNLGAGIDFPLDNGREVSLYTEGLDHFIFWQGLTQVVDGRFGIRFMLDTAHVDPFR